MTTAQARKAAPKVTVYELVDKKGSGFFLDGTQDTPHAQELNTSTISWIPASGYRAVFKKDEKTGEEVKVYEEIRYIPGQEELRVAQQNEMKLKANEKRDKIMFNKGLLTVVSEGHGVTLNNYLRDVFYNENSENRPQTAGVIFRKMDLDKVAEELLEDDTHLERALAISNSLKTATGKKDNPWSFNEEKLDALCALFNIQGAETVGSKAYAIAKIAKTNPRKFVELAETFEQKALTEVSQAIDLDVIVWDKNTAIIKETKTVVVELGTAKLSKEDKVSKLSDFLKTSEGESALNEIRILVAAAKEKLLN